MFVVARCHPVNSNRSLRGTNLLTAVIAIAVSGCSADITRFDSPYFATGDGGPSARTAVPLASSGGGGVGDLADSQVGYNNPVPPYNASPQRASGVETATLPPVASPVVPVAVPPPARQVAAPVSPPSTYRPAAHAAPTPPASDRTEQGATIEVQRGDTVYGLARRHGVSISELMSANGMQSPNIWPGQKLKLPGGSGAAVPKRPAKKVAAAVQRAPSAAAVSSDWSGTYVVKAGDSIYAIARRYRVKSLDIQRANGIADARRLRPGTTLKVPGPSGAVATTAAPIGRSTSLAVAEPAAAPHAQPAVARPPTAAEAGVKIINGGKAAATPGATRVADAAPAPSTSSADKARPMVLRWPVKGRIISGYGKRADGSHNDGVDIAVPFGTDVLAAEDGVVAYAGNEVKTYGNLVLIRHDNGWVTAYAYNDKVLVQRGDRVKRGQAIAKAGKSGAVDQPQLHFEVRIGAKPVDPLKYLDKT